MNDNLFHWVIKNITDIVDKDEFYNSRLPNITIKEYIKRIDKYMYIKNNSDKDKIYCIAIIYLNRLMHRYKQAFNIYNIYRHILIAIVTAVKYIIDKPLNNNHYSRVGGIGLKEFNNLELLFLYKINFDLYISDEEYIQFKQKLTNNK